MQRTTLAQPTTLSGIGLFSAQPTTLTLRPARAHTGIVFHIGSPTNPITIPAHIDHLSNHPVHPAFASLKPRCTSVGNDQLTIATIEHLLSAIVGLHITDLIIEIDSNTPHTEIPILDGSANDFVHAVIHAGLDQLPESIEPITITKPITIQDPDDEHAFIRIEPADRTSYSYTIDYPQPCIANTTVHWLADTPTYIELIAPARTFCLEHEANAMQAVGLFSHLDPSDMLVLADTGPINNTLRHPHECALHKLLDLIGDLALVGKPMRARVTANRSGHALAHAAARTIVDQHTN